MRKVFVNLSQVSGSFANSWTASVAIAHGGKNGQNEIAIGESVIYSTKQQAWESIKKSVEKLDFEKDEIYFNYKRVQSYTEVKQLVGQL